MFHKITCLLLWYGVTLPLGGTNAHFYSFLIESQNCQWKLLRAENTKSSTIFMAHAFKKPVTYHRTHVFLLFPVLSCTISKRQMLNIWMHNTCYWHCKNKKATTVIFIFNTISNKDLWKQCTNIILLHQNILFPQPLSQCPIL